MTTSNPTMVDPVEAPYTSVVGLRAVFSDGSEVQFSGALISPTEVITASHGVWEQGLGAAVAVVALPEALPVENASVGKETVFQSGVYAENYHYNPVDDAYDELFQQASAGDYALVHFGTPLIGTAAFTLATSQSMSQQVTSIAGFPYSGPEISSYGYANYKGPGTFDSEISLGPGSSGGPIWTTGANGVLTIIGTVSTPSNAAAQTASSYAQVGGWEGQDASTIVGNTVTGAQGGLYTQTGDTSFLTSMGADTIQADAGTGVIYAAGGFASVLGGSGQLVVVCGAGNDTVRPGTGSATLYGGTGGGVLDAGFGGGSDLVAGGGNATLVGGGNGDALFCSGTASTAAAGGGGQEVIVGGGGLDTMVGGQGTTVAFAGTAADTFSAFEANHGTLVVVGFNATDTLQLNTVGGGAVQTVTANYGTTYTFANGSEVVVYGTDKPGNVVIS